MIAGCYTLDLYCDTEGCQYNVRHGMYEPDQFTAETGGACRRKARKMGWAIDLAAGLAWCPECRKKGRSR